MSFKFRLSVSVLMLVVGLTASSSDAYQIGKGKFESFNGNRYTEAKSMNDNDTRAFFNVNRNQPPAHDTPASPCSCSE